jgi:hypothetical protein
MAVPKRDLAACHGDLSADLLVKNLPRQFTDNGKESLLQYFGAKHVISMGTRGKMVRLFPIYETKIQVNVQYSSRLSRFHILLFTFKRNSVYATFTDSSSAKQV